MGEDRPRRPGNQPKTSLLAPTRPTLATPAAGVYSPCMSTVMRPTYPAPDGTTSTRPRNSAGVRPAQQRISIGNLTLVVPRPTKTEVQENVRRSTEALGRALVRLTRPGIRLRPKRGIPLFQVDENDPDIFIRDLDGKRERGLFQDGEFKVTD